jgi:hypothetical protein
MLRHISFYHVRFFDPIPHPHIVRYTLMSPIRLPVTHAFSFSRFDKLMTYGLDRPSPPITCTIPLPLLQAVRFRTTSCHYNPVRYPVAQCYPQIL